MPDNQIPPFPEPTGQPAAPPLPQDLDDQTTELAERPPVPLWAKVLIAISAVAVAVGIAGTVIRLPYDTLSPGKALSVAPLVTVHGARSYPNSGNVMLLFVRERDHVNVWSWLQAKLDPNIDLLKQSVVSGGQSTEETNAAGVSEMTQSQLAAKAAALTALGYHLQLAPGLLVTAVLPSKPAGKVLLAGDQIVAADGHPLKQPSDLAKFVEAHAPGTSVSLRILRGGRPRTVAVGVASSGKPQKDHSDRIIGVLVLQTFKFPVQISVDTSNITGPSAGLAMTLAIIDNLSPGNLTGGKRVAVTGTITPDGQVGEIGGLPQKAVAAKAAHAQIFIVPVCVNDPSCTQDLKIARQRVGKHVDVEPVATLAQALRVLRAAGGAPVHAASKA